MAAWLKLVPAWAWWALALAVVAGGQQFRVLSAQAVAAGAQSALLEANEKLGACRATRSNLLEQVIDQNSALADLRASEQERAARARQSQGEAREKAKVDYQAANRLQQERTGGDACAAAESIIDQELGL